jgi:hypothetical protein
VPWIVYFGFRSHGRSFYVDFHEIAEKAWEDELFALKFRQLLRHLCKAGQCEHSLQAFFMTEGFGNTNFYDEGNRISKKKKATQLFAFFCIFV